MSEKNFEGKIDMVKLPNDKLLFISTNNWDILDTKHFVLLLVYSCYNPSFVN